jgi:hypothetical protein
MGYWLRKKFKAASDRGRRMANARWAADRKRRDQIAARTAEQNPPHIVERIVRIVNERHVSETVVWSWDSDREAYRKKQKLLFRPL